MSPRAEFASGDLVGRGPEVAVLEEALDRLDSDRTSLLTVNGAPGIGKSRLLTDLGARADLRGMLVLSGSASEFEGDLPLWLFVDALDEYLRGLPADRLADLDQNARTALAEVLPSWPHTGWSAQGPGPGPSPPGALQDRRLRLHAAVRGLLELLAATRPVLLLLDDVHWADPSSQSLLAALRRRPPAARVLIAVGVRPRQLSDRMAMALDPASPGCPVVRLDVQGLSLADAGLLLGPDVDRRACAAMHAESGGNPFYLQQLAALNAHAIGAGAGPDGGAGMLSDTVPAAVGTALATELGLLPPKTRQLLEGASVAGDPFEPELAAAAVDVAEDQTMEALDDLLRRDLVRPTAVPRRFRFRHPLVRRAVYEAAPAGWRLLAHQRCGARLAARGVSAAGRAHHLVQSARPGDREALELLRTAAGSVAQHAPAEAARWYRVALDLLPPVAPTSERLGLLVALAQALGAAGNLSDAREALLEAIPLVSDTEPGLLVHLVAECAGIELTIGYHDAAHRRLTSCLDRLTSSHTVETIGLLNAISQDELFRFDYAAATSRSRHAHDLATGLGEQPLLAVTTTRLALSACFDGDLARARTACTSAASQVDGLPDEQLGLSADPAAGLLAAVEMFLDRLPAAVGHAERGLSLAQALGSERHLPVLCWTGVVWTAAGSLERAAEILDDAVDVARTVASPTLLAWAQLARSLAGSAAGEVDLAVEAAHESVDALRGPSPTLPCAWAGLAMATALELAEAPADAERALLTAAGGEALTWLPHPLRPSAFELLTRIRVTLGDEARAERAAAAAAACAESSRLDSASAMAHAAAAALALARHEPTRAADLALAAADAEARIGLLATSARHRLVAARGLVAAGQQELAIRHAHQAADDLDRCGAPRLRSAADRELRRLGYRRLHRRTRPGHATAGLASLTEREWQVARLVTDRLTNAEIARELYLSTKTVESHVRNLFHKLAVSSRIDVARVVEDADVPH